MSDQLTIREARDLMRPHLSKGIKCLCCHQRTQMYSRSLTSSMIYALISFSNADQPEDGFIHAEDYFKEQVNSPSSIRGDFPKNRFWGFIESKGDKKEDGNPSSGYYKITQKGLDFICGKILVQKKVKLYNNQFYGFDGPETDVFAVIKNKFDYQALMNGGG